MVLLVIFLFIAWILALLLWRNEKKHRKAQMEILREEIKQEIHWAKFYKNEYTKRAEVEVYMRVLKIIREIANE